MNVIDSNMIEHDVVRKPVPTFRHHALAGPKSRFSELVDRAQAHPQTVKRNGKPTVVVVSSKEWARKTVRKGTLAEFRLSLPLHGAAIDLERESDALRDIRL